MSISVNTIPSRNIPFTDSQGRISPVWHEFLRSFVAASVDGTIAGDEVTTNVIAGAGLVETEVEDAPEGDLTLAVGAGNGITVNANDVNVDISTQLNIQAGLDDELMISDSSNNNAIRKTTVRSIASLAGAEPGGTNSQVQYNLAGFFYADSGFTYNGSGSADLSVGLNASTIQVGLNEQGTETIRFNDVTGSSPARIQADGNGGYTLHAKSSGSNEARLYLNGTDPLITFVVGASTGTIAINNADGMKLTGTTMPLRRAINDDVTASTIQAQGEGALTGDYNNITTVANNNDTVTLPANLSGRYCLVINNGANLLQVFPASGSNLGLGTNVATTIIPGSHAIWFSKNATLWYQIAGDRVKQSLAASITASTTQTQGQQPLTKDVNEISVVANANDTVTLPTAPAYSRTVIIINNGANTLKIFPAAGDNLGTGVDTSTTLASGANVRYTNFDATNWEAI